MSNPALELVDCTYAYDGQVPALRGVSCAVEAGSWLAIVGQNGSGKTTLAKLCNGLLRPQQGTVRVLGEAIDGRPVGDIARHVGYLFQNPDHQIFASTVRQEVAFGLRNLGYSTDDTERRTNEALAAFDLSEYADHPPALLGYGSRRQVTLASLFAHRSPILVLDEPTTGLDWETTERLLDRLGAWRRAGHTIVFVTHNLRLVAERATDVLVLHRGRVLLQGRTRDVLTDPALTTQAGLDPPPITRLSQELRPWGVKGESLMVEELCQEVVGLVTARSGTA